MSTSGISKIVSIDSIENFFDEPLFTPDLVLDEGKIVHLEMVIIGEVTVSPTSSRPSELGISVFRRNNLSSIQNCEKGRPSKNGLWLIEECFEMEFVFPEFTLEINCSDLDKARDLNGGLERSTHTIKHCILAETIEHDLKYTVYLGWYKGIGYMLS
jgi:hypothetical protein